MNSKPSFWTILTILVLLAAPAGLALTWAQLPAQLPTHFDAAGHANGFTAKENMWLLCGALPVGTFLLVSAVPYLDPKKRLNAANGNLQKLRLALVALMSGLSLYSLYLGLHGSTEGKGGLPVLLGAFFLFLGNYLTTVQPNYFVGVRTPWTLESPAVWVKTHRLTGRLLFGVGLLGIILGLALPPEQSTRLLVALVIGAAVVSYAYSYVVFRQEARAAKAA